jgi:voltage-gated potassium channel Kch
MSRTRFADRLRYAFDNSMSRGAIALIGYLGLASICLIAFFALIVVLFHISPGGEGKPPGFMEAAWLSLMRTLDSGTMGGDEGWSFRVPMLGVTLGGIFLVSALIGVINNGIEGKLEELRKGRSFVVEKDHTLILGWSPKIFTILSELVLANENRSKPRIVILAEKDKVEMEDEIRTQIEDTRNTRIICRTGSSLDLKDLEIVNPRQSRSVIVLGPEGENPDSEVIKTILALTNNPDRRPEPYHIVAELQDLRNVEVARMVGRDEAQLIVSNDLISRIIVQTSRQSGLSVVYTELLDFGGDEIYFTEEPKLVGRTFAEALLAYEDSCLMGLRRADGGILINPPMDMTIAAGDQVIAISEDDDTVKVSSHAGSWENLEARLGVEHDAIRFSLPAPPRPEKTLILGWNRGAIAIINELDRYVAPGSVLTVVADAPDVREQIQRECVSLVNQEASVIEADTTDRRVLDGLGIPSYDQIVLLCYSEILDAQEADARTLITLLHLRDMADKGGHDFRVVSEMLDVRNRELAEVTQADDFIVSNKLISLMLSQVSENKHLNAVFANLFDPEGSEIYLKNAAEYVEPGREVNFYTLTVAASQRGQVAIGYRLQAEASDASKAYGVVVNPKKSKRVSFTDKDWVIVLAED